MLTCHTGKRIYPTEALAIDALIDAHARTCYSGKGPIAVYLCEDCGYWHFTSKGKINDRLDQQLRSGKMKLQQEANRWINKFKK
ncbi:MAG: hypothetical protein OJF59_001506 [Cytophagales bacterium]|jgi:hypothetical protein|nr:hypothetical protein [Bacteroidota bacterium]MBS1980438.1 hypothetical protein [Bacteroidota bacterium]WHZ07753.1 MAG: hypothetical protein OJF59_001506 [Cytophagales bacterium]